MPYTRAMAALLDPVANVPEIVDLRRITPRELDPLLLEETTEWETALDWDFSKSADLVRKFSEMRALAGCALVDQGEVAGYGYSVLEEHKGLVGDLYVRPLWRGGDAEIRIFRALLDSLIATPRVQRIESQLMLVEGAVAKALQRERFVRLFERVLMGTADLDSMLPGRRNLERRFRLERWAAQSHDAAAALIALAYRGHVDAQINDQYQTLAGRAAVFVQHCAVSGMRFVLRAGLFCCLRPQNRLDCGSGARELYCRQRGACNAAVRQSRCAGRGAGYELLRQSLHALQSAGARGVSLTVTASNAGALELYRRCGFRERRRFFAYVWEGY